MLKGRPKERMPYANSRSNNSRMSKDDEQLKVIMKWTAQDCRCNEQLRIVDAMNNSGLLMQWTTQGCWCNEQLRVVDAMNNSRLWMTWTTQEEWHCKPKRLYRGLWLQVKPLKDDQDEGDQLIKNGDLNASREGDASYETQRKRVALMKLKKNKNEKMSQLKLKR